jgi:hypothetical protein
MLKSDFDIEQEAKTLGKKEESEDLIAGESMLSLFITL